MEKMPTSEKKLWLKVGTFVVVGTLAIVGAEKIYNGSKGCVTGVSQLKDSDCDSVPDGTVRYPGQNDLTQALLDDFDSDGVPNALDRFYGDNYGDIDGDGFANWADADPYSGEETVDDLLVDGQVSDEALRKHEYWLEQARIWSKKAAVLGALNGYIEHQSRDRDGDGLVDMSDTQPNLPFGDDDDGDSIVNGRDYFPLDSSSY